MSASGPGPRALTPDERADLEPIFAEAAGLAAEARARLLDDRCAGRPHLRSEVEALLASHDRIDGFLAHAPGPLADAALAPHGLPPGEQHESELAAGDLVGPYRLTERIGEGGMGSVFLAERVDGQFARHVAVKVTHASLRLADAARRFRAERQILATLQHPNIVTMLDGGTTPLGEAYLVMEHVAGCSITEHCRVNGVTLEGRLELLRQVASAVQWAHQHGIVHRDLKPGNILVTAAGVVKVLDFGVAKLLEAPVGPETTQTRTFLTPSYASPEQLRGLPVTTASDIYALGVLAYELLAGARPFDTSGRALDEVLRQVLDTEPKRPSDAASDAPAAVSPARLRGDLDAVVLKAIAREPERRYGSAAELADDLDRYLTGHPVVAREPSIGYLLRRLASRHKAAVATAAAAIILTLAALGVAVWQRQLALRAQAHAERRFNDTRQLANTLIFKVHDAIRPLPGSTPVREMIVSDALAYLERLERDAAGDPSLQFDLSRAYRQIGAILGNVQSANLGDRGGARVQFEKARRLALPLVRLPDAPPAAHANLVNVNLLLMPLVKGTSGLEGATPLASEAVSHAEVFMRANGGNHEARRLLGRALFGQALLHHPAPSSVPLWETTLEHYELSLSGEPSSLEHQRNVALVSKYLGSIRESSGDFDRASPLLARAAQLDERRLAVQPGNRITRFDVAVSYSSLASVEAQRGRLDDAARLYARSLELREQLSESDPRDVLARGKVGFTQFRLGLVKLELGHLERARQLTESAVANLEQVERASRDQSARHDLAGALFAAGLVEERTGGRVRACALYERSARLFEVTGGAVHLKSTVDRVMRAVERCRAARNP